MASRPQQDPSAHEDRRLSVEEARFFASVYGSARKGTLGDLRRKGCSEEEAEEFFSMAFEKVIRTVDPIARDFTAAQMVSFIKRSAWRCMVDARRQPPALELDAIGSLSDPGAEGPDEIAEVREAVAIGREVLQMLPERDRLIFRQRYQMDLTPEEILHNMPGLSLRTYRKIINRANTRVLDAFERIEGGKRCEEMERRLLRRYVAGESPEAERDAIRAHLVHCQACRRAQAQMDVYLLDVAAALLVSASAGGASRLSALTGLPARLIDATSSGAEGLLEASRAARERAREALLRIASGMPGFGGEATVGQAVTASSAKVAAACATAVATGTCIAAGLVPGIGGIGLLNQHHDHGERPAKSTTRAYQASGSGFIDTLPSPAASAPEPGGSGSERSRSASRRSPSGANSSPASSSPASARESSSVTSSEFGAESGRPASPQPSSSAPSVSSGTTSSGSGTSGGGQGGSASGAGGSSEFGL